MIVLSIISSTGGFQLDRFMAVCSAVVVVGLHHFRSFKISRAAFLPLIPVTPPPGWVAELHR